MRFERYETWKTTPIGDSPFLSIIIPTYNEEERIIPTIGAIASHVSGLDFEWELIVADDGSSDSTLALVRDLGFVNLRPLEAERNGGKGSAVRRGMLAARGSYVLFADADNSTPIEELDKLLSKVRDDGYDVAIGSRAADGAEVANKSLFRKVLSGGLNWIVSTLFQIKVKDTQCGFKLFSAEAAQRLHQAQTIDGFSFDLEILYLADKLGYRIAEVPVSWYDAPGSKVDTTKEMQRFLRDLVKIKVRDLRGGYVHA